MNGWPWLVIIITVWVEQKCNEGSENWQILMEGCPEAEAQQETWKRVYHPKMQITHKLQLHEL